MPSVPSRRAIKAIFKHDKYNVLKAQSCSRVPLLRRDRSSGSVVCPFRHALLRRGSKKVKQRMQVSSMPTVPSDVQPPDTPTSTRLVGAFDQHEDLLDTLDAPAAALLRSALDYERVGDIDRAAEKYIECLTPVTDTPKTTGSEPSGGPALAVGCCLLDPLLSSQSTSATLISKGTKRVCWSMYGLEAKLWAAMRRRKLPTSAAPANPTTDAFLFDHLGQIFFERGFSEAAQTCYTAALELCPKGHSIMYHLGILYYSLGRLDEAQKCFERALQYLSNSKPTSSSGSSTNQFIIPVLFSLGTLHRDLKNYDMAQQYFQRILEQQHHHIAALVLLSDCLEHKGQLLDASLLLQTALTLDPSDYTVRRGAIRLAGLVGASPNEDTHKILRTVDKLLTV